jgi:hypothetical protein
VALSWSSKEQARVMLKDNAGHSPVRTGERSVTIAL